MGALFFDQNVGINNTFRLKEMNSVSIYPNPFSTSTTIEFDNEKNEAYSLLIYNTTGQLVRKIDNITTGKIIVARENLTRGFYVFHLMNKTARVGKGKLIVE